VVARLVVDMHPLKIAVCAFLATVLVVLLAWLGLFVYWHVRIQRAIAAVDRHPTPEETMRGYAVLSDAGPRSLPYLVRAVDPGRHQSWIWRRLHATAAEVVASEPPTTELGRRRSASLETLELFTVDRDYSPLECRDRHARLASWWASDGPLFHSWWRIWSSR
jgi:hypothetical protein